MATEGAPLLRVIPIIVAIRAQEDAVLLADL
jgi:hypothetical protein